MRVSTVVLLALAGMLGLGWQAGVSDTAGRPNVVVVLVDDMGYGDLGSSGHPSIRTPHLDRMAREGFRAGAAYAPSPSCSPTRAALMTGRYAHQVGIRAPLGPRSPSGLRASDHVTLPQVLRQQGYRTMLAGKWHLGDQPGMRPMDHAFDRFVGMLYSHDYKDPWVQTPEMLALFDGETRRVEDPDAATLTGTLTAESLTFIRGAVADKAPFFLYLAHPMPHVPLAVPARWQGVSTAGLYGDVVAELDDSVGQIRGVLTELGVDRQTLVVFTSDNGPWNVMPDRMFGRDIVKPWDHGSTGPFRGGKAGTYEGGHRVPFLAVWPGRIPEDRFSDDPISIVDLLPTIAGVVGARAAVPADVEGTDIWPLLAGDVDALSERPLLYDHQGRAEAVRLGPWKLRVTRPAPDGPEQVELFHLLRDPGERHEVASQHPDVVARLRPHLVGRTMDR
jgi:arylsulfatase A